MKVVILDDINSRRAQIVDALSKNKHEVIENFSSNEFMNTVESAKADALIIDMETWNKGRSIYNYFAIGKKLEKTPILFYNAEEGFSAIPERSKNEKDQILRRPSEVQSIVDTVQQMS